MGQLVIWLFISGVTMFVLYGVYMLLLSSERQATFNRKVLLGIYVISILAGFLYKMPAKHNQPDDLEVVVVSAKSIPYDDTETAQTWLLAVIVVFVAGAAIVLLRRIIAQIQMMRVIKHGECRKFDRYELILVDDDNFAPFSWYKYIVMSRHDYELNRDMILSHEKSHLDAHHWLDLIIADIVLVVEWFNPAAWMMRDELKNLHEYQADACVLSCGYDPKSYQLMLIGKAIGKKIIFTGNSLNHGKLKKRLAMMIEKPASKQRRVKAALLIPVLVLMAYGANTAYARQLYSRVISIEKFSPLSGRVNNINGSHINGKSPNATDEKSPAFFVDGEETTMDGLQSINPSDIESIVVRKDNEEWPNGRIDIKLK